MLWVTRSEIRVNRAATGWLIRRFIDPAAKFCFVAPNQVAGVESDHCAIGFDAPGARYPHKDRAGRCSFEALVDEHRPLDRALKMLACIVHCADFPEEAARPARTERASADVLSLLPPSDRISIGREDAAGLRTISRGFPLVAADDHETLDRSAFLYNALYASLQERLR